MAWVRPSRLALLDHPLGLKGVSNVAVLQGTWKSRRAKRRPVPTGSREALRYIFIRRTAGLKGAVSRRGLGKPCATSSIRRAAGLKGAVSRRGLGKPCATSSIRRAAGLKTSPALHLLLPPNIKPTRPQRQQPQGGRSPRSNCRRAVHLGHASVCHWARVAGSNRFIGLSLVSVARQRG